MNFTSSAPVGLWYVDTKTKVSLEKGIFVEALPPSIVQDFFVKPLLKQISAVPGDVVIIRSGYPITVNGRVLQNSKAIETIGFFSDGIYTVSSDEVWLLSTYDTNSLDSRYFGPVPISNIKGRAFPILVREK